MKKNREKKKNKYNENNLEEPLNNQDMKLNINIINSDLDNNNNNNNNNKKVSFCSRLFFLWTLIIMKL